MFCIWHYKSGQKHLLPVCVIFLLGNGLNHVFFSVCFDKKSNSSQTCFMPKHIHTTAKTRRWASRLVAKCSHSTSSNTAQSSANSKGYYLPASHSSLHLNGLFSGNGNVDWISRTAYSWQCFMWEITNIPISLMSRGYRGHSSATHSPFTFLNLCYLSTNPALCVLPFLRSDPSVCLIHI